MSLKKRCEQTLLHLKSLYLSDQFKPESIVPLLDLTLLDEQAFSQIGELYEKAVQHQVAAICILPQHLPLIPQNLTIPCATVINFPTGNQTQSQVLQSIESLQCYSNLREIDYVFPYQSYLTGHEQEALAFCREVSQVTKQNKLKLKIILETGAFSSLETIFKLCVELIHIECDFLKTSTGKITNGATLSAAFTMLCAIKETNTTTGIKYSGGIRTIEQAYAYMYLSQYILDKTPQANWFRFGASSLLNEIIAHN